MAGYEDTRQKIISTLMGRPNGTEIQPENHQDYALNMLDYIRSLELIATSTLIGIAESNTTPVQPNDSRVCYIAGVAQNQTVTFENFIAQNGNPISITTGDMEGVFVILMWNTQYWSAQTFSTNILSHSESATFYYRYNIRKTYASIALMNADVVNPIGTDGKYIKVGDIVTVVNSTTPSENGIFSYEGATDGWKYQSSFNFQLSQTTGNDPNVAMSQASVTSEVLSLKTSDKTEIFVDSYQELENPQQITDFTAGKLINFNGEVIDFSDSKAQIFTITNSNSNNQYKYVKYDFGNTNAIVYKSYLNVALYDENNKFVKGFLCNGTRIMQIPQSYTLRISRRTDYNNKNVFVSNSLLSYSLASVTSEVFVDSYQELENPQQITDFTAGKLINFNGEVIDGTPIWRLYEISNVNQLNYPKFIKCDFGKSDISKDIINVALYDENNKFVKGFTASYVKILRLPSNYSLKLVINSSVPDKVFSSSSCLKCKVLNTENVKGVRKYSNVYGYDFVDLTNIKKVSMGGDTGYIFESNTASFYPSYDKIDEPCISVVKNSTSGTWAIFQISNNFLSSLKDNINVISKFMTLNNANVSSFIGWRSPSDPNGLTAWHELKRETFSDTSKPINQSWFNVDISSLPSDAVLQFYIYSNSNVTNDILYFLPPIIYNAKSNIIPMVSIDSIARQKSEDISQLIVPIRKELLTNESALTITENLNQYINLTGVPVSDTYWKWVEIDFSNYEAIRIITKFTGGNSVSILSLYDSNDNYLYTLLKGNINETVNVDEFIDSKYQGIATKIKICVNINYDITVNSLSYPDNKNDELKVQTWGNSITAAGQYQKGIASELLIPESNVKNAGIASDYSMHVRRRFVSYFSDENPFVGTGTYSIPSLSDRLIELQNSFFVFWIGTNNLLNPNRSSGPFTTGSASFMALQPNPDFKYDRLYSKAYKDMFLDDLRQITQKLKNGNFAIIGGHGGFMSDSEMRTKMLEIDSILSRMYPRNYIDIRELVCMDYNYQNTFLNEDFIKPELNSNVNIKLSSTTWIGNDKNTSNDICIGTKTIYDKYHILSIIDSNTVQAKLIQSNTEFITGDTIRKEYLLVSDLGRDAVNIPTQVFSYEDCVSFGLMSFPRSSSDPIHFTTEQYIRIGQLIAKEIIKIKR